ncbi:MAG: SDR family NAD(P)-dependent oxidoreductase [Sphingobium sp.]
MSDPKDMSAIVTGAAGGIGRATSELLASTGWRVLAVDRNAEMLQWTEGHSAIKSMVADIADEADNIRIVETAEQEFGGVDSIILNAALSLNGGIEDFPMEDFDRMVAVNLRGTVIGIRAAIPALRRRGGGSIVVTASTHGLAGDANFWAYSATKHGVVGVVKSAARELGWEGIRINAVCPGPTRATGLSTDFEVQAPDVFHALARNVPIQRWGEPKEIAAAIAFLANPASSFVTGIAMPVDGGGMTGSGLLPPNTAPTPA